MSEVDKTVKINNSLIQHGPENDRVYIMKIDKSETEKIIHHAKDLATDKGYGKIFAKVPASEIKKFDNNGFQIEAKVPGFYSGKEDGVFMAKYFDDERSKIEEIEKIENVIKIATNKAPKVWENNKEIKELNQEHANEMANIYQEVFESYPFPIHDPNFLKENMENDVSYFGILQDGELVSISSSEKDPKSKNVEMTDFATLPHHRGQNHAFDLLCHMNKAMQEEKYHTAYTIARAQSIPMNVTFANAGYKYSGTLKNNTNISGSIESMNIWYKQLPEDK